MKDHLKTLSDRPLVAAMVVTDDDALQSGVKGMKWGVRRSSTELKQAAAQRPKTAGDKPAAKPTGTESSSDRYNRLQAAAKAGQGRSMSDDDLKFFNARTEALKKVDALNRTDPSWLSKTTTKVLQNGAEKTMQDVVNGVANKYITKPLLAKITTPAVAATAAAATP